MCNIMEETRKEFIEVINNQYAEHCKLNGIAPTVEGFSAYMVNRNIVTDLTINRFLVIHLYPIILSENMGIKQATCWDLEFRVGVKERSIRNIINHYLGFFWHKNRIKP